jgi:uncharacterized phiE125 gp8 family phage protein
VIKPIYSFTLKTPQSEYVLTLAEAKAQVKMEDDTVDDTLIEAALKAADQLAQDKTGRAFMQSTWEYVADSWDCNYEIKLWPAPLVEVVSVKYYDETNTEQTLSTSDYQVDSRSKPGRVLLKTTPSLYDRFDAITIEFVAGYGVADAEAEAQRALVPDPIKSWVKLNIATLYENRQLYSDTVNLANILTYSDQLIFPYIL